MTILARAGTHPLPTISYSPGFRVEVVKLIQYCVQGASELVGVCSVQVKLFPKPGGPWRGCAGTPTVWQHPAAAFSCCAAVFIIDGLPSPLRATPPSLLSKSVCCIRCAAPPTIIIHGLPPQLCAAPPLELLTPVRRRRRRAAPPSVLSSVCCPRLCAAPSNRIYTGLPPPPRWAAEYYCNRSAAAPVPRRRSIIVTGPPPPWCRTADYCCIRRMFSPQCRCHLLSHFYNSAALTLTSISCSQQVASLTTEVYSHFFRHSVHGWTRER